MGCGPQPKVPSLQKADTLIGILKISVIQVLFPKQAQLKNPFLKVRVSNQQFSTKNLPLIQKENKVNEIFTYTINSFYKAEGRTIEVGVFEGDDFLAYGAIDANPLISKNSIDHEFRCILASDKNKKFGHARLNAVFEERPATQITFRFESATIRRKGGDNKVSVKLIIGQQQLQTKYQEDTPQKPPIWKDQMLNYKVPEGITKAQLKLIDGGGKAIGRSTLDLSKMVDSPVGDEVFVAEQLFWQDEDKKEIDAANLKYSYIIGQKATFSPIADILRSSVRGIRSRNEIDEPNVVARQK